ncbi:hypothetical protein M9H77_29416 [Catharanthus roseus]|uniref:Uncharacterized protein n=1 Tax=Catharanthus roseus TaxID=4058 RepID=A0ACB9ZWA6_CATRO|nr:hypothetical protein M9H77_29416 [Catharanthus roseus]
MAMSENWQLFVYNRRNNHAIGVYHHDHTQAHTDYIQRSCQDEEEKDTGAQHGRRSSLFKCSTVVIRLHIYYLILSFKFKFMMAGLYNMPLLEFVRMTPTKRRTSPSRYMRWLDRRPRCSRFIIYSKSKWGKSTRKIRVTITTPHTRG